MSTQPSQLDHENCNLDNLLSLSPHSKLFQFRRRQNYLLRAKFIRAKYFVFNQSVIDHLFHFFFQAYKHVAQNGA